MKKWLCAAVVALVMAPASAWACDDASGEGPGPDFLLVITGPTDGLITIGSVTTIVGTALSLRHHPPSRGWRIASYVMGSFSVAMSVTDGVLAWVTGPQNSVGTTGPCTVSGVYGGFAAHEAALAIANYALAGVSTARAGEPPDHTAWALLPKPLRLSDFRGHAVPALGFAGSF